MFSSKNSDFLPNNTILSTNTLGAHYFSKSSNVRNFLTKVFYLVPLLRPKKPFFEIGNYINSTFELKLKLESKKKFFSESENLLIYWLTFAFENIFNKEIRFSSFRDLRTSTLIAAVIGKINKIFM